MSLPFPSSESSSTTTEQTSTASETSATGKDGQSLQENLMRTSVCFSEQGAPTHIEAHPHSLCVPLPGWRCHFCTSMGKGSCSSIPPDGSYPISCPVPQRTVLVAETPISNPGRKLCSLRGRARARECTSGGCPHLALSGSADCSGAARLNVGSCSAGRHVCHCVGLMWPVSAAEQDGEQCLCGEGARAQGSVEGNPVPLQYRFSWAMDRP